MERPKKWTNWNVRAWLQIQLLPQNIWVWDTTTCQHSWWTALSHLKTWWAALENILTLWFSLFTLSLLNMTLLFQSFHTFTHWFNLFIISLLNMTLLFNLLTLSHSVPLSLVHNVVFPLSCESGGYLNRSVCTPVSLCLYKSGGSTSIHIFIPFYMRVLAPNIGGSGHFILLLSESDYMRFSFLWYS